MESKINEMCQLSFQYHILKMNGHPTSAGEPVAMLAVFMIEIHGQCILNRPKLSSLSYRLYHLKFLEDGTRSKLALVTLDVPNGCAQVRIPTHMMKNRKYQFEFEGRD